MATYADVVLGRLLLNARLLDGQRLAAALPRLAAGQGLAEAAVQQGLVGPQAVSRCHTDLELVLTAERERALARLLHEAGILEPAQILEAFEVAKGTSFWVSLGARLLERGLLDQARVEALYALSDAGLQRARQARQRALDAEVAQPLGAPGSLQRLELALQLCEPLLDLSPELEAARRLAPRGAADPLAQAQAASEQALERAPEDCPIYGYEIEGELGQGAMGVVYKARHIFTGRTTALKILPLDKATESASLERFKREAMAMMRLQHDNVVRAYDFGGSDEHYYLALEFVDGESLVHVLEREGRLPERRTLEIGRQVALGLGCAHQHGVIHRDVKPENILVTAAGAAKLCDFGIVKLQDVEGAELTQAGTTVGTPYYISPEQARGESDLDIRSDLYSLGISLWHLATGRLPFSGESPGAILVKHILEPVPDPRSVHPDLGAGFCQILAVLTAKAREDRYATPADLVAAIDAELGVASA